MRKITIILITIFLSGCFFSSSPEYREELYNLEVLVKNVKKENIELLKNNNFKTYNLDKLRKNVEDISNKKLDEYDIEVKVKEEEINNFLEKDILELIKLADEKGYNLIIDKDYWKNKTENVGNLLKINIFSLREYNMFSLSLYKGKYDDFHYGNEYKNCDIFYSLFEDEPYIVKTGKESYIGYFFTIFVNEEQWKNIKEKILKVQDKWKRIKDNKNYKEDKIYEILENHLSDYPKYKSIVAIIKLKFVKKNI